MSEPFVHATEQGVVVLAGDLDAHSAPHLDAFLERRRSELPDTGAVPLVIDISDVAFVDSSGLRSLVMARRGGSTSVVVRGANRAALRLFEITGLETEFEIER